ncbi:MAG: CsbD family protein [Acidimicrobiales bacterium]
MTNKDKMKNKAQQLKGKAKELAGHSVGNESLTREGKRDQTESDLKQAVEKVKDALRP